MLLLSVAISLLAGLGSASAQNASSCFDWCRANKCSGGIKASGAPRCMNQCVEACQKKMSKTKQS